MNTEMQFEDFSTLLDEYFSKKDSLEGTVVKGTIVAVDEDAVTVDVGLKSEGRIAKREFGAGAELNVGDTVDVYIDR